MWNVDHSRFVQATLQRVMLQRAQKPRPKITEFVGVVVHCVSSSEAVTSCASPSMMTREESSKSIIVRSLFQS